jgi:hypothetical protein
MLQSHLQVLSHFIYCKQCAKGMFVIEQKLAFPHRLVLEQKNVYENRLNMSTASVGCSFY